MPSAEDLVTEIILLASGLWPKQKLENESVHEPKKESYIGCTLDPSEHSQELLNLFDPTQHWVEQARSQW